VQTRSASMVLSILISSPPVAGMNVYRTPDDMYSI
jgi:hypothetical protein